MNIDEIRGYRNAQPFQPFDILMQDGSIVHVALAERMAISRTGRMAYVFEGSDLSCLEVARFSAIKPKRQPPRRPRKTR